MPHLFGERIVLREYRASDLPEIRKWVNDPEITEGLSDIFLFPHTQESTEGFLASILEGRTESREFIVAEKSSERFLGQIGLQRIDWKNRYAVLSVVFPREHQGKGYGTEALRVLLRFVFDELGLHRLELLVHDNNAPAIRCYERCGFREEGRFRQQFFRHGRFRDILVMAILAEEYRALADSPVPGAR